MQRNSRPPNDRTVELLTAKLQTATKLQTDCEIPGQRNSSKLQDGETPEQRNSRRTAKFRHSETPDRQQTAGRRNSGTTKLQTDCEIPGQRNSSRTQKLLTAKLQDSKLQGQRNYRMAKRQLWHVTMFSDLQPRRLSLTQENSKLQINPRNIFQTKFSILSF